ncbi:hypothetical protein VTK73DRAFT_9516 [Phialemonium thermophilum]|uniref:Sugar phosphate transporter domain-containing protein n=1 Tax=Phialemonium thermophilum TaxID=223376 RepID=A0ABR3Y4F1_9PEZI
MQPSPSASNSPHADIEMRPVVPSGHRRRRSSLMNADSSSTPRSRRRRRSGPSNPDGHGERQEPTISEESTESDDVELDDKGSTSLSDEDLHDDEETGLQAWDRQRRRQRRKRNTRMDQRVVRDSITDEERKEGDQSVLRKLMINGALIGLWYIFSLSISLYNKWMFDKGKLDFPFPLFTTALHMLVQFTLASLTLYFIPSLRPQNHYRPVNGQTRAETESERPLMTKMFYLTRIGPCGAATGLDIGLGNTSLKFITLTFYTMCKSSSLGFVLLFAFLFRLETPTWKLVAIIATMTGGVIMMVAGEIEFKLGGFILVISAAFFSGFRWALTQILLLRNPATSNPFSSIFFLAPVMFVSLIVIAVPAEGLSALRDGLKTLVDQKGAILTPMILLFPGTLAFLMTASEFALLQRTSVVTLSIAGIFKEVVTIIAAALVFGDRLTPVNFSGLIVTIGAIAAYNYIKITKMRNEARAEVHRRHLARLQAGKDDSDEEGFSSSGNGSGGSSGGEDEVVTADRAVDDNSAAGVQEEERGLLHQSSDGPSGALRTDGSSLRQVGSILEATKHGVVGMPGRPN